MSQGVTDKHSQWSDSGPIKRSRLIIMYSNTHGLLKYSICWIFSLLILKSTGLKIKRSTSRVKNVPPVVGILSLSLLHSGCSDIQVSFKLSSVRVQGSLIVYIVSESELVRDRDGKNHLVTEWHSQGWIKAVCLVEPYQLRIHSWQTILKVFSFGRQKLGW